MAFDEAGFTTSRASDFPGGDFDLGGIAKGAGSLASIANVISGLVESGRKRDAYREVPGLREALAAAVASRTYASAAADPNSPWFRNLAAMFKEAQTASALQGIRALQARQASARARGAPGILANPDRRDEAIAQAVSRTFAQAGMNSQEQARQALLGASGASAGAAGAFGAPNTLSSAYGQSEYQRRLNQPLARQQAGDAITETLRRAFPSLGLPEYDPLRSPPFPGQQPRQEAQAASKPYKA